MTYQEQLTGILRRYKAWLVGDSSSEKDWLTISEALDAINALNAETLGEPESTEYDELEDKVAAQVANAKLSDLRTRFGVKP